MQKYTVTVGADPEFFVQEKKTKKVVPSCRKFGGEKKAPMFLSPDGGYLEDGTTVEFNVTPSKTLAETKKKIEGLLLIFLAQNKDYEFTQYSSAEFPLDELKQYPEAMEIGCSPDLFAYGLRVAPDITKFGNKRFAGGHIHLGIDPWPDGLEKSTVIKMMDALMVMPTITSSIDTNRYPFYGHPGLYRETSYGVEHRSPDNSWCNPEANAHMSLNWRKQRADDLEKFDMFIENIKECLEFDGHGSRVNKDFGRWFKEHEIDESMGNFSATQNPEHLGHYRSLNESVYHLSHQARRERTRMRDNALKTAPGETKANTPKILYDDFG